MFREHYPDPLVFLLALLVGFIVAVFATVWITRLVDRWIDSDAGLVLAFVLALMGAVSLGWLAMMGTIELVERLL